MKFANQKAMAAYISEWLKEGTVDGIWKKYNLPMTDEVPSLRTALERGGDTGLIKMSKYGKRTNEFSESRMQRHMRVVHTLMFMHEHGELEETAVEVLQRWYDEISPKSYYSFADALTVIKGQAQSGGTQAKRETCDLGYKDRKEKVRKKVEEIYNIKLLEDALEKKH